MTMKPNLTFGLDDFVREKSVFEKLLLVTLADGSLLYQDDGRFGPDDKFWLRLKKEVESRNVPWIKSIELYYRERCQEGFSNSDIFFYSKKAIAEMGDVTRNLFLVGGKSNIDGCLDILYFNDAGIGDNYMPLTKETRNISDCNEESLIRNTL